MSNDLITDLSVLTTIPESTLYKLVDKSIDCICNDVFETMLDEEEITKIDFGIGSLYIKANQEEAEYHFIPSSELEDKLATTIREQKSPLVKVIEEALVSKITNVYKELL